MAKTREFCIADERTFLRQITFQTRNLRAHSDLIIGCSPCCAESLGVSLGFLRSEHVALGFLARLWGVC